MKTLACTTCRQDKLKCDATTSLSPGICTRCKKLNKSCIFDPNFKRVSKKTQVQQLRKELKKYKHALISGDKQIQEPNQEVNRAENEVFRPCTSEKILGAIVLPVDKINELFESFFAHCHSYLSFPVSRSVDDIYADCPLLFWVICCVASVSDRSLHLQLYPQVKHLISEVTLYPARKVETIQALLIACMWPFPSATLLSDSSFLLSGMANHIGLQIGLHRPDNSHEFSTKPDVLKANADVRRATWLSCFLVSYWQTTKLGVPNTFVQDFHFVAAIENPATPAILSRKCKIGRLSLAACTALGSNTGLTIGNEFVTYESRINMIKLYIKELTILQMTSSAELKGCPNLEIMFLGCRLQVFSFALVEMPVEDIEENAFSSIEIFYQAEMDALRLIDVVNEEIDTQYAPIFIIRLVTYSSLILLWILKSKYANNKALINQHITTAQEILSGLNRYEQDEPQRAVSLICSLSRSSDKRKTTPVRSRMSATLLYESIRMSKENSNDIIERLIDSLLKADDIPSDGLGLI